MPSIMAMSSQLRPLFLIVTPASPQTDQVGPLIEVVGLFVIFSGGHPVCCKEDGESVPVLKEQERR